MSELNQVLFFKPVYQTIVWGGERMATLACRRASGPIGESWEISQQERGMSVVADGPLAGKTLAELCASDPEGLVGQATAVMSSPC